MQQVDFVSRGLLGADFDLKHHLRESLKTLIR